MGKSFVKCLAVINVVFVALCIISYVNTIFSLEFWTDSHWASNEVDGVLDFRWFGISTVCHLVRGNLEPIFSFLDLPSYFLLAVVVSGLLALFLLRNLRVAEMDWVQIRSSLIVTLLFAVLCAISYNDTISFISRYLTFEKQNLGGTVYYQFPYQIWITHVYQGQRESSLNWHTPDFTLYLLIKLLAAMVAFAVVIVARRKPEHDQTKELSIIQESVSEQTRQQA